MAINKSDEKLIKRAAQNTDKVRRNSILTFLFKNRISEKLSISQSEMIQIWSKQGQETFEWNVKVSYCQPLFT